MRRLIFCFDGSWSRLSNPYPTNVVLLAESIAPIDGEGVQQIVYYDEGVGTGKGDRWVGGAFGVGLETKMRSAYRFLIFNYQPDDEIFVFGFSRGAFTAMSFVGFLRVAGVLTVSDARQIDEALNLYKQYSTTVDDDPAAVRKFRATYSPAVAIDEADRLWRQGHGFKTDGVGILKVKYLGVWDIVSSLGLPVFLGPLARFYNQRYRFYNARLSKTVESARHAVATDEPRTYFAPRLWTNLEELNGDMGVAAAAAEAPYQQHWFPGDHGSIGGGGEDTGLSNISLGWVLAGAVRAGLKVQLGERSRIVNLAGDFTAPLINTPLRTPTGKLLFWLGRAFGLSAPRQTPEDPAWISPAAKRRWLADPARLPDGKPYRPKTLLPLATAIEADADRFLSHIDQEPIALHQVKLGESLASIARHYYGETRLYTLIFEANRDTLDNPDRITPGMRLRIPPPPAETPAIPGPLPEPAPQPVNPDSA